MCGIRVKKVGIIGAGPAGLTAAYELSKNQGVKVTVLESGTEVGGMAKSIRLWNQTVDLGPHRFFSSDPRVNRIWLEAINGQYQMVNRLTRIYYQSKFFHYPLKAGNALKNLGIFQAILCVFSYVKAKIKLNKSDGTFEDWVTNRFGSRLYKIFFKSYSEKLWGISCRELDSDFATQRIKKLSLYEAVKAAFFGNKNSIHKTLVDEFAYPNLGAGAVYEEMAKKIIANSGEIRLNEKVKRTIFDPTISKCVAIELQNGEILEFDHIVSTMPITNLVKGLNAPEEICLAANKLRFRNTILVYLNLQGENPFPDQWIYVHSPDLETGRITNFRNWATEINNGEKNTILCLEYWCFDDEKWNSNDEDLIKIAVEDIYKSKLVTSQKFVDGKVMRVPKCYPVYSTGYKDDLVKVQNYLSTIENLSVIGRYGAFKYNNQDHSILMGLLAAENIAKGTSHDLWEINTDYNYQEQSLITATGLINK